MSGDRAWWVSMVQWVIWGGLMSLVMGWIGRSRNARKPTAKPGELRYPTGIMVVGAVTAIFFIGLPLTVAILSKDEIPWGVYFVFAIFALLGIYIVIDWAVTRYQVDDGGISWKTPIAGSGHAAWTDIRCLKYSGSMRWFLLETSTGRTVRVAVTLMGLPEFARLCLTRLPEGVIEANADALLKEASIGNLPSLWG